MSVRTPGRIVIAIDPDAPSDLPLELVEQLFHDAATELLGLFVEDARLLAHAQSRLAREIVFGGGERAFDPIALARHFRARAAEARARFDTHASDLGVKHGFAVRRGDVVAEMLREAANSAALVVELGSSASAARAWRGAMLERLAEAPSPAVLFTHESWRTGEGIVSVIDESDSTAMALRTALRFAVRARAPLSLLVEAATTDERAKLTAVATDIVAAAGVELRALQRGVRVTPDTVARAAEGARLLVLPRRDAARSAGFMSRLLIRLRTPLLLIDSGAAVPLATASRATGAAPPADDVRVE